jgi:hypothetical protein
VCLVTGVHDWQPGVTVDVRIDATRVFAFDTGGKLVAVPYIAMTA